MIQDTELAVAVLTEAEASVQAARYIGAGIATLALAGVGIGLGNIFGSFVAGALRNPSAAPKISGTMMLGFALTEAAAIFALLIAFLILFL